MKPQLQNYLNYTAACLRDANESLGALLKAAELNQIETVRFEAQRINHLLVQGNVITACGDGLDHLAIQCGVPARNGVPVPDEQVREAIIAELDGQNDGPTNLTDRQKRLLAAAEKYADLDQHYDLYAFENDVLKEVKK